MSVIDDAISRLQVIALACTALKAAPAYPVSDATVLPLAIAYITTGTGQADDVTTARLLLTVSVDVHFNRQSIKDAYTKIDKFIPEYLQRLAGDPTLNGKVDTIIFPVSFNVVPAQWDQVTTQMVSFQIPLKFLETPTATP
jgi:hypothetical protein